MSDTDVDSPKSGGTYPIGAEGAVSSSSNEEEDQPVYYDTWSDESDGSPTDLKLADVWREWLRQKLRLEMQMLQVSKKKAKLEEAKHKALEREQRRKEKLVAKNRLQWLEKKNVEEQEKRKKSLEKSNELEEAKRVEAEKLEMEKQKTVKLWLRRKREEQKALQTTRELEDEEKERLRLTRQEQSEAAFKAWFEKAKSKPKPMSVRIADSTEEARGHLTNYNPNAWVDSSAGSEASHVT